jgi:RNA polymerase sigma factor (sigma-70 family)
MEVPELDAEELAQDVLLKMHSKVGTFQRDGRANLTTWIFQIALNLAKDFHEAQIEKLLELNENDPPVQWDGEFAGRNSAFLAWLKDELEKFSADDVQLLLWRAQDFTYAEIGGWLGVKKVTARVRHCRAKKKLDAARDQLLTVQAATEQDIPESGVAHE